MISKWPKFKLGEVLVERREEPGAIDLAFGRIKIVAKIGFNDGLIQIRADGETKTGMILIYPGDIVVSGINAAKGAIAIYEEKNTEPIAATIHYGAYTPQKDRVDIRYLWWLLRSNTFRELLAEHQPGGIKTELKAKKLLPIPVPMPPLTEQRRIVARVEELAAQINEARTLRRQADEDTERLIPSFHMRLAAKRIRKLGELLQLYEDPVPVLPDGSYPQVGVKSFGAGLFAKPSISGTATAYKSFNRLYDGALILSQVKGWEGAVAVCPNNLSGWVASPEYRTFQCLKDQLLPAYLAPLVRTEWFWKRLSYMTRGVGARRERIRPEQFLEIELPMPEIEKQRKGQRFFAEIEMMTPSKTKAIVELDALLPSILDKAFKGEL